ncbi:MAG: DNA repair protein RecO [Halioglobus sp.]|nr:DNA repair protein RecO [Halioglobus sp.]
MRVNLQPAYVIHSRPYRDSSALLDVFTAEYGRLGLVARGTRRQSRRGSGTALLQPFIPLLLSFSGRSELKTLVATERAQGECSLRKERIFCGMYMNELLVRMLHRDDAHPALFSAYDQALKALAGTGTVDTVLRRFEYQLLDELGYNFDLGADAASGQPIQPAGLYRYERGVGLVASADSIADVSGVYPGAELLAMASGEFGGSARLTAKRLLREALAEHLGEAPLRSRELFRAARAVSVQASTQAASEAISQGDLT